VSQQACAIVQQLQDRHYVCIGSRGNGGSGGKTYAWGLGLQVHTDTTTHNINTHTCMCKSFTRKGRVASA
jgi:hypothetical protein